MVMSAGYNELLDATIQHLENLKARGVRHVAVEAETLRALHRRAHAAVPVGPIVLSSCLGGLMR